MSIEVNMKSLGIISEFNPFHNGHKFLLDKAKSELEVDLSISIMSGDFVQRGEPAIIDKFTRSRVAVKEGFDLVIEMPSFVSLQAAPFFALKSVDILDKLNVDYLVFGIENISPADFLKYSDIIIEKTEEIDELTKKYLDQGLSYTKSHNHAIENFVDEDFLSSNNILALEYIRAIKKLNSNIIAYPIKRIKTLNKDKNIKDNTFASSTAIRKNINSEIECLLPKSSHDELRKYLKKYNHFDDELIYSIFRYKILIEKCPMDEILGYEQGISNYLYKLATSNKTYNDFLDDASSQRYTRSRIKRLILNYILNNEIKLNNIDISFIKVLSYNKNTIKYFKDISSKTTLILNKKDIVNLDSTNKLIYEKMIQASNLYSLGIDQEFDFDFKHNNRPIDG